jgi:hypothetical protein
MFYKIIINWINFAFIQINKKSNILKKICFCIALLWSSCEIYAFQIITDSTDLDFNTTWKYIGTYHPMYGYINTTRVEVKVVNDTIIEDRYCHMIASYINDEFQPESLLPIYKKDGRVYFYEGSWKLIYDFTVQVGDAISYYLPSNLNYYHSIGYLAPSSLHLNNPILSEVNNVGVIIDANGETFKTIHLNTPNIFFHNMHTIIDGIGSEYGLFGWNDFSIVTDGTVLEGLICYSDDNTSYEDIKYPECMISSTDDENSIYISISPNPASQLLNIRASLDILSYEIMDQNGKILLFSLSSEMDISNLLSGMYFIGLRDSKNKYTYRRFIKL